MIKTSLKMVLMLGVLATLIVGVSGCVLQNPISTQAPTNKALDYANAFVNTAKSDPEQNNALVSSKVVANGSDAAQISVTAKNTTKNGLWSNGSTATLALNVKQFSSKDEATTFYDSVSFGYTTGNNSSTSFLNTTSIVSPYKQVMGHEPSLVTASYKLDSFNFISVQASVAVQTDEFVIWGTVSAQGA